MGRSSLPAASESKPSKMSSDRHNAIARTLQPSHFLLFVLLSACDAFFTDGTEDSYVQFPRWQPCLNGSIGFEFKSEDPNGLLLYTDDGGRNDWFELRMENRKLKLRFVLFYTPNQREMQEIITSEYKMARSDTECPVLELLVPPSQRRHHEAERGPDGQPMRDK